MVQEVGYQIGLYLLIFTFLIYFEFIIWMYYSSVLSLFSFFKEIRNPIYSQPEKISIFYGC